MKIKKQKISLLPLGEADYQLLRNDHPVICPFQPMQLIVSKIQTANQAQMEPPVCSTNCALCEVLQRDYVADVDCPVIILGCRAITYYVNDIKPVSQIHKI